MFGLEFIFGTVFGLALGLGVLAFTRGVEAKQQARVIEHALNILAVARSPVPADVAQAINDIGAGRALNEMPIEPPKETAKLEKLKMVLLEGTEFEIPHDSPLNKLE